MRRNSMIVILVPENLSFEVVSSQLLVFANYLTQYKKVTLLVGGNHIKKVEATEADFQVVNFENGPEVDAVLRIAEWVYIRGSISFIKIYFKRIIKEYKFKLFYDFRGLVHDESYLRNQSKLRRKAVKELEKFASKRADQLGAVSKKFEAYLKNTFKTNMPIYVTPCCIENVHRKEFIIKKEMKFVYLGGISAWQCFDEILVLYKRISDNVENVSLTIITKQTDIAARKANSLGLKDVTIKTLTHDKVLIDLCNYDFGFLLREKRLLNEVASPIKFLEYTSRGIIPIITKGIGDFSEEVEKNNIGILLDSPNSAVDIVSLLNLVHDPGIRKRLENYSCNYLWESFIKDHPLVN
jgi:glycosyltransferase involved in cell wall biosynthesis